MYPGDDAGGDGDADDDDVPTMGSGWDRCFK